MAEATTHIMNNLAAAFLDVWCVSFYRFETRASDSFGVVKIELDRKKALNDRKVGITAPLPRPQSALPYSSSTISTQNSAHKWTFYAIKVHMFSLSLGRHGNGLKSSPGPLSK